MTALTLKKTPKIYQLAIGLAMIWALYSVSMFVLLMFSQRGGAAYQADGAWILIGGAIFFFGVVTSTVMGSAGLWLRKKWSRSMYGLAIMLFIGMTVWLQAGLYFYFQSKGIEMDFIGGIVRSIFSISALITFSIMGAFLLTSQWAVSKKLLS